MRNENLAAGTGQRVYPAENHGEGYTLSERTLGQWLEHWAETTPDKEYIVYSRGHSSTSV